MNRYMMMARAANELGLGSVWRVILHRFSLRLRLNPVCRLPAAAPRGPFFHAPGSSLPHGTQSVPDSTIPTYFGWFRYRGDRQISDWHLDPFSGKKHSSEAQPWWTIPDFDPEVGDIKCIWELSRFGWVWDLALRGRTGDESAVRELDLWLRDWCRQNPPYLGPNWKCGQEASIRVMNLAMAALILEQAKAPSQCLLALIHGHLARIAPTIGYAVAQNNNHGTSEAAALFLGGSWLYRLTGSRRARTWLVAGRRWLENRVRQLVAEDGSFSQYSVNYHRMLLDTLSMVEIWRRSIGSPSFSPLFRARCRSATQWLHTFTIPQNGDAPNLGPNDGSHLLNTDGTDYRDYRPSVELASNLFLAASAYPEFSRSALFRYLGVPKPKEDLAAARGRVFDRGGYAALFGTDARLFITYPRYRFRPNEADALHVDLWIGSRNVLRDGGSFSYAAESQWRAYFSGTASHNTVQFDGRDQMPRISRFLYGCWLRTSHVSMPEEGAEEQTFCASYRDYQGAFHWRKIQLCPSMLRVEDRVGGFREKAVLRWRLLPGDWQRKGGAWCLGSLEIRVSADMPLEEMRLVEGWESRYYLRRDPIPVLEVESSHAGSFHTELRWSAPREAKGAVN